MKRKKNPEDVALEGHVILYKERERQEI